VKLTARQCPAVRLMGKEQLGTFREVQKWQATSTENVRVLFAWARPRPFTNFQKGNPEDVTETQPNTALSLGTVAQPA
jgi:hypothetical protein